MTADCCAAGELRRIMCVEDDPDIRMLLEFALATVAGYEVRLCPDGQAALAQAPSFRPDLLLLDVMMPVLSGPDTLAALREQPGMAEVPAVFMTAKSLAGDEQSLLRHGAAGVIAKPFDLATLKDEIHSYWELCRGGKSD